MASQKDPSAVAKKWATNLGNSTTSIQAGVQALTTSPTSSAAAKADKWQQKLADPATKTAYVNGLNGVSLSDWQNAMINKGLTRISSGAQAATPKFQTFMTDLLPYQATLSAKVAAMPDLTLQDSINRMTTFVQGMAQYKKKS